MDSIGISHLVLQNIRRKPYRAVVIALCVAVASGSLFFATILLRGVQNSLTVGQARLGADIIVVPEGHEISAQEAFITGEATSFMMSGDVVMQILELPSIEKLSEQVFVQTLTNASCCIGEFFLVGYNPDTDFTISPWLATNINNQEFGPFDVIAGDRILLRQGDSVVFYGTTFNILGVLEKTGMGIDRTIYVPMEGLRVMIEDSATLAEKTLEISPTEISSVMIRVQKDSDILDVAEQIESKVQGVQVFTASQLNQAVGDQIKGVTGTILGITIVIWVMSLFMIGLIFSLIVNERKRELGLLRAMGATEKFVFRLVLSEASLLTGLGGLIGILTSGIVLISFSRLIIKRLGIPFLSPNPMEIILLTVGIMILSLITGILASLQPAISSSRMEPYEAVRQGE
ncbi:MAG: FtsX-like permease family protein [Chloroflexi bacterium]|nr:FtsX-like permease family protein [Chloroflexota bacterium]MBT3670389.1 FtsX-like permease family protein [Chloroflexota bacterium]MBT4002036.1 FtsX-like permease family protein [Chloroflexota bacterium]MBT4305576.1 FtsX-like permease family protein [Chloroflexota bacterium]MBT4533188.1 FtsX-like permease family protein [Chloroflexota bacterium]